MLEKYTKKVFYYVNSNSVALICFFIFIVFNDFNVVQNKNLLLTEH